MPENLSLPYANEEWYKRLPDSQKKLFDAWYASQRKKENQVLVEIANIKEEIFETSYGLKGSNYLSHPMRVKQLVSRARKIIPQELLTERLDRRIKELERKVEPYS